MCQFSRPVLWCESNKCSSLINYSMKSLLNICISFAKGSRTLSVPLLRNLYPHYSRNLATTTNFSSLWGSKKLNRKIKVNTIKISEMSDPAIEITLAPLRLHVKEQVIYSDEI